MTEARKKEVIGNLQSIVDSFVPSEHEKELTMFGLISRYNQNYDNKELIGGEWVEENAPDLLN